MSFITWANSKVKKMDWADIKLAQFSSLCVGIIIGAYFSVSVLPYWWIFIIFVALAIMRPIYRIFIRSHS